MEKAKLPEFIETKYEEKNNNPAVLEDTEVRRAVVTVIDMLDRGELRVATPPQTGDNQTDQWRVNAWVKKAILMY
ncbi:MAG TPA: 2,3,4,5-tetrahydropyridine-2,6-dicarboxylate N-succinyltransferase, partial [Turneriella sp.]|nr:2,3,4,5-tetrahydropyridine-2,6-dicarboxylate N-succinyltransferase [Turneriella sp.]